jgi:hypothetical protein
VYGTNEKSQFTRTSSYSLLNRVYHQSIACFEFFGHSKLTATVTKKTNPIETAHRIPSLERSKHLKFVMKYNENLKKNPKLNKISLFKLEIQHKTLNE